MSSYFPIGSHSVTQTSLKYENVHKVQTAQNSTPKHKTIRTTTLGKEKFKSITWKGKTSFLFFRSSGNVCNQFKFPISSYFSNPQGLFSISLHFLSLLVFFLAPGFCKLFGAQGSPSSGSLLNLLSSFLIHQGDYHDLFVCP